MHAYIHTYIPTYIYIYTYIHTYIHTYYVRTRIHTGLEIGSIATPHANLFWGYRKSLWQSDSPNFFALRITFGRLRITFQMDLRKDLFLVLTPFLEKIFPFLGKFYTKGAKM